MLAMTSTLVACGDEDDGDDDGASADGASSNGDGASASASASDTNGSQGLGDGVTDCSSGAFGDVVCQAGQYCDDMVLSICENGCLSNDNCTSDQTCEKASGEDVGSCQNTAPGGPTEEEFCMKVLTCDPSGTMELCSMLYAGTNEACHQCIDAGNCGDINEGSCNADCGF